MKETTYISFIAYAYNDEDNIIEFLTKVDSFLYENFASYEIILVNDNSKDDTLDEIYKAKDIVKGNVTVINLWEKHGVDRALFSGTDISIGDYIYELESINVDYPMEVILDMYYRSTKEGYDMVFAKPNAPLNFVTKAYAGIIKRISKEKVNFENSTLRLVTRRALYAMTKNKAIITDRNIKYKNCGFSWVNMFYDLITPLKKQNNKMDFKTARVFLALSIYTKVFDRIPFFLSGLFFVFGLLSILTGILNSKLTWISMKPNYIIATIVSIGFSLVFLVLGMGYKKLNIIINSQMNTEVYKVKDIKRINKY